MDERDADHGHNDRLAGRAAKCADCGAIAESSVLLPFFTYKGPGSAASIDTCDTCGYYSAAHTGVNVRNVVAEGICHGFVPHGAFDRDSYYCGCHG